MSTKGNGKTIQFLRDHTNYPHRDWCLIWPFSTTRGYGTFGYLGKGYYAHRFMCELAHGTAPEGCEAAHSCGDEGCVNPNHLSWKTPRENMLDCRQHGTHVKSRYGNIGKITAEQAEAIRALKNVKTLREIAEEFDISESTVSKIQLGRTHSRPSKVNYWTAEEDAKIREGVARGMNFRQLAAFVGRPESGTQGRVYRLGLKSGQPPTPSKLSPAGGRQP